MAEEEAVVVTARRPHLVEARRVLALEDPPLEREEHHDVHQPAEHLIEAGGAEEAWAVCGGGRCVGVLGELATRA